MTETEIEWGPVVGGVATRLGREDAKYRKVYDESNKVRKGDLIRVYIPGMWNPIELEAYRDGAWVEIHGQTVAVADRSNGAGGAPGQMWRFQVGKMVAVPTRADAIEALPEGTLFFISPPSVPARAVFVRTDTGTHNLSQGRDVPINGATFGWGRAGDDFPYVIGKRD